jgi:hypothetical protein
VVRAAGHASADRRVASAARRTPRAVGSPPALRAGVVVRTDDLPPGERADDARCRGQHVCVARPASHGAHHGLRQRQGWH